MYGTRILGIILVCSVTLFPGMSKIGKQPEYKKTLHLQTFFDNKPESISIDSSIANKNEVIALLSKSFFTNKALCQWLFKLFEVTEDNCYEFLCKFTSPERRVITCILYAFEIDSSVFPTWVQQRLSSYLNVFSLLGNKTLEIIYQQLEREVLAELASYVACMGEPVADLVDKKMSVERSSSSDIISKNQG